MEVKYPDVTVQLTGIDGNAFMIMAVVNRGLRSAGHDEAIEKFMEEAQSGDYDNVLVTAMKYVNVD